MVIVVVTSMKAQQPSGNAGDKQQEWWQQKRFHSNCEDVTVVTFVVYGEVYAYSHVFLAVEIGLSDLRRDC